MKVLAVDDDPMTLQIIAAVVESAGHECVTAANGRGAWQVLTDEGADVVISDWHMPDMDGIELCRRIRAQDKYTYVVLVSGRSGTVDVLAGMEAGADDYLTKPLDITNLRMRLIAAERVAALHGRLASQQAEMERLNADLAEAARVDALTGMRNRRALDEDLVVLLGRCARHGHELSAVMVDVDYFKAYNDHFGHQAGDEALRSVAGVLLSTGRQGDLFYRYGGEEILCLLPQGADAAMLAAERFRRAVHGLGISHPGSSHGVVTFSAGVASWVPGMTAEALVTAADTALYRAKSAGRNAVYTEEPTQVP